MSNEQTINECERCPFYRDPDPYPVECLHPKAETTSQQVHPTFAGPPPRNCPIRVAGSWLLKVDR